MMKRLPSFTFKMGSRFGAEVEAQLRPIVAAKAMSVDQFQYRPIRPIFKGI
jgi:hypothetical protein